MRPWAIAHKAEALERLGIASYGDLLDLDRLDLDLVVCVPLDDGAWGKILAHRDDAAGPLGGAGLPIQAHRTDRWFLTESPTMYALDTG